jgi:predicted dehydrogenase
MAKWNVGIVGYGWAAGAHIEALNQVRDVRVSAVCSARDLDSKELSHKHGGEITVYHDFHEMLSDEELQVVSICSVPKRHAQQTIAAAKAGKHVIVEKPIALSWSDCQAMQQAVDEAKVRTCVCFEVRYSSQFTMTKSLIDEGLLGDLHFGEVDYYHGLGPSYGQFRWNIKRDEGGSSLLSAGCHALDGLLMFMGSSVDEVMSYATNSTHPDYARYEYPSTSVTILKFAGGAIGKVASSIDAIQPYYLRVHLFGSQGTLLDGKLSTQRVAGLDANRWTDLAVKLESSGDVSEHPYRYQFNAFFSALEKNENMPLTSLRDAMRTHAVIFAADRSAQLGRPVKLTEL